MKINISLSSTPKQIPLTPLSAGGYNDLCEMYNELPVKNGWKLFIDDDDGGYMLAAKTGYIRFEEEHAAADYAAHHHAPR